MFFTINTQTAHASEIDSLLSQYDAEQYYEINNHEELIYQAYSCFISNKGIVAKYTGSDYQTISLENVVSEVFRIDFNSINDNSWLWGNMKSYKKGFCIKDGYSIIAIKVNFKRTQWEMNQIQDFLKNIFSDLNKNHNFNDLKEADKARIIYDYVIQTYEYDHSYNENAYDTFGAMFLNDKKAVCQAYSLTYYYLCNLAGIKTKIVCSSEANHSLNMSYIDGSWYYVDCTWGDEVKNPDMYFLYSKSAVLIDTSYFFYPNLGSNLADHNYFHDSNMNLWLLSGLIMISILLVSEISRKKLHTLRVCSYNLKLLVQAS